MVCRQGTAENLDQALKSIQAKKLKTVGQAEKQQAELIKAENKLRTTTSASENAGSTWKRLKVQAEIASKQDNKAQSKSKQSLADAKLAKSKLDLQRKVEDRAKKRAATQAKK